ncbi:MAG: class I SAM-dependent methyltransferase [Chloroflexi bacterium]|nr:class I SAM-dependent methyltransferase [Chloroflexota bacterium]
MNLKYLILRLLRHFIPESLARFLLKRRWIIKPGLESNNPSAAVSQYIEALTDTGRSLKGKRILVFGYGGRFAVGVELLRRGAAHVVLCDHFVLLDKERNLELLPGYADYLLPENDEVKPRPEFITLLHGDIREQAIQNQISEVDVVLSTSVYEHLDDVDGITQALAKLTAPDGVQLHFVDLRDHYFKYPFEMLKFSDAVWRNFLNPTSNLNRFRLPDYRRIFEKLFTYVAVNVLERRELEFNSARSRIRQEFLTDDAAVDSVTLISIYSQNPKKN